MNQFTQGLWVIALARPHRPFKLSKPMTAYQTLANTFTSLCLSARKGQLTHNEPGHALHGLSYSTETVVITLVNKYGPKVALGVAELLLSQQTENRSQAQYLKRYALCSEVFDWKPSTTPQRNVPVISWPEIDMADLKEGHG